MVHAFHGRAGTRECTLVVLDARQLEQGPVATLRFRQARRSRGAAICHSGVPAGQLLHC